jgi:hypothetical protein
MNTLKMLTKMVTNCWPAAFCAFLSFVALHSRLHYDTSTLEPALFSFACWLPMCFFFVGIVTFRMHLELCELRKRLADLEQKKPI